MADGCCSLSGNQTGRFDFVTTALCCVSLQSTVRFKMRIKQSECELQANSASANERVRMRVRLCECESYSANANQRIQVLVRYHIGCLRLIACAFNGCSSSRIDSSRRIGRIGSSSKWRHKAAPQRLSTRLHEEPRRYGALTAGMDVSCLQ